MLRGVKRFVALLNAPIYRQNEAQLTRLALPVCDCLPYLSDDYYRCFLSQLSTTVYHPVGTSKMGPDSDPDAVVECLPQIDAGIMPLIPSANTNAATMMVAERGADFIKWKWSRENQSPRQKRKIK